MFKFDFEVDEIEKESPFVDKETSKENEKNSTAVASVEWYESEQILPSKEIIENLDVCKLNSTQKIIHDTNMAYMVSGFLLEDIKDNGNSDLDIKKAEDQHCDLIPGVYEGGAKIWECTEDLLNYLSNNFTNDKWNSMHVLDLGCGSGLLGIYALLNGANVTFQDYNKDVLEKITIPNVLLNTACSSENQSEDVCYDLDKFEGKVRFYSGDWDKWRDVTKDLQNFDVILTSETIYNPQNQQKLIDCLHDKLKLNGRVLVAAKTYYFGVGGCLRQFEKLVDKAKSFTHKVVWKSSEGVNREIIELIKVNS